MISEKQLDKELTEYCEEEDKLAEEIAKEEGLTKEYVKKNMAWCYLYAGMLEKNNEKSA